MRKARYKGLSEQVREFKRKRREQRFLNFTRALLLIVIVVPPLFSSYVLDKRDKPAAAPAWADFIAIQSDDALAKKEWVAGKTIDGVPTHLTVNGEMWSVARVDIYNDALKGRIATKNAETDCEKRLITYIQADDPAVLRNTLMHEVFHAGACLHGGDAWWNSINPNERTHPGIYHLGDFMADFARNNPLFMEWIER